jgi:hypothetical protein
LELAANTESAEQMTELVLDALLGDAERVRRVGPRSRSGDGPEDLELARRGRLTLAMTAIAGLRFTMDLVPASRIALHRTSKPDSTARMVGRRVTVTGRPGMRGPGTKVGPVLIPVATAPGPSRLRIDLDQLIG